MELQEIVDGEGSIGVLSVIYTYISIHTHTHTHTHTYVYVYIYRTGMDHPSQKQGLFPTRKERTIKDSFLFLCPLFSHLISAPNNTNIGGHYGHGPFWKGGPFLCGISKFVRGVCSRRLSATLCIDESCAL